jgi:hemerythrin superfamily protein
MHDHVPIPARSPTASLLSDRRKEIETLLEDVRALTVRHSYVTAAKRFGQLYRALEEHTGIEEQLWLPRIIERWPERTTTLEHARADHVAIRETMHRVGDALSGWNAQDAAGALDELSRLIARHHTHEDEEIYPAVLALRLLGPS